MRHVVGWNTYYVTSNERDFSGPADTVIADSRGNVIATVPRAFANDLFIEGSGRLRDGRVVTVSGNHCGPVSYDIAGYTGEPCYKLTNTEWGVGVRGWPVIPLRSIAVNPRVIPYGSRVYIPQWVGRWIPQIGTIGGFNHDGMFVAADTGGFTQREDGANHIDIFAGSREMYRALERIYPTRSRMDLWIADGNEGMSTMAKLGLLALSAGGAWYLHKTLKKR